MINFFKHYDPASGNCVYFTADEISRVVITETAAQIVLKSTSLQAVPEQVVGTKKKTLGPNDRVLDGDGKPVGVKPSSIYIVETITFRERPNVLELKGNQRAYFINWLDTQVIFCSEPGWNVDYFGGEDLSGEPNEVAPDPEFEG